MRLQIASDLHLEWHADAGEQLLSALIGEAVDALVLAGDVVSLADETVAEPQLRTLCQVFPRVYYVPGNHDFYGLSPKEGWARLTALAARLERLVVLDTGRVDLFEGHRFLGGTMWFPPDPDNLYFDGTVGEPALSDFVLIEAFVPWVYEQNAAFRAFLEGNLQRGDIVVTHHLPTFESVHPDFKESQLNRFFVSDQHDLIVAREPALWVHGHAHHGADYAIGETRIVCNPCGYPGEGTQGFRPTLTLDV